MANEIVAANFVLILVSLFLLIVILIFLIATRRQIRNIGIGSVAVPMSSLEPSIQKRSLFGRVIRKMPPVPLEPKPQQPVVVERMEEEAAKVVGEVQQEVVEKELPPPPEPKTFKCKKCQKEFSDKKKLQRHIGMAHYKDLEI